MSGTSPDSSEDEEQGVLYLFPDSNVAVSTVGGRPTALKLRVQILRTNERTELKGGRDCPILDSFDGEKLSTKSSLAHVLSSVKEYLTTINKNYISLGGSGTDSLGVRAIAQSIDSSYNDFDDDAYDALSVSLVGRNSTVPLTIITADDAWQASLTSVGLRFSGEETLRKNADLRFVLIDVVVAAETAKGKPSSSAKKAKTISEKDMPPSFAKVVLRELTVTEGTQHQTRTTAKFGQIFIIPILLPSYNNDGDLEEPLDPEAVYTTMDIFRVAVFDAYFKQKSKEPIGKMSKLYMSPHTGRNSMEEISSTVALVTMLTSSKTRSWVEPDKTTAVEVQCSLGHMVSGGDRADQAYIDEEKTRASYVKFKKWAGPILLQNQKHLPPTVARMSSIPSEVTLDDHFMSQSSDLQSPEKVGNAALKSINSATRPAAIERLILALNTRPDSPFHHGINHMHAAVWAAQLLTRLPVAADFEWLDKEPLTMELLQSKSIIIDWVPHVARCGSEPPKSGAWVPEDATKNYKTLKGSKEIGKATMSPFEEAIVGAMKNSSSSSSSANSTMLNITRVYTQETHAEGKQSVSTCILVNVGEGETLKSHLDRVRSSDMTIFAQLFHCGTVPVADAEAQYSINLNSSGGEKHVRPFSQSTIQSVPMSVIMADTDVARPLTLIIRLRKKEGEVPACEVMNF
jgi:hypothetical protein